MANPKVELALKKLRDIPKGAKAAIVVVPSVVVGALLFFLLISPKMTVIKDFEAKIIDLDAKINDSQSKADRLKDLMKLNNELKSQLEVMAKQLPEMHETTILLGNLAKLAKDSGLDISSWKPSQKKDHPSKIVYESPVSFNISGNYHQIGMFFGSLTTLDRIVNLKDINISVARVEPERSVLGISLSAVTFSAVGTITDSQPMPAEGKK